MGLLSVCSPAFYPNTNACEALSRSSRHYGINVKFYGIGVPWDGFFNSKIVGLLSHAEAATEKYILCVDACDSVIIATEAEIVASFLEAANDSTILIQQDRFCFPHWGYKLWFDANVPEKYMATGVVGKYPCGGCIMAERNVLIDALKKMIEARKQCPPWMPGYDDDQGWWEIGMVNGFFNATIDFRARLSACLNQAKLHWFEHHDDRLVVCGAESRVLHFSGRSKGRVMKAYLKRIRGIGIW